MAAPKIWRRKAPVGLTTNCGRENLNEFEVRQFPPVDLYKGRCITVSARNQISSSLF